MSHVYSYSIDIVHPLTYSGYFLFVFHHPHFDVSILLTNCKHNHSQSLYKKFQFILRNNFDIQFPLFFLFLDHLVATVKIIKSLMMILGCESSNLFITNRNYFLSKSFYSMRDISHRTFLLYSLWFIELIVFKQFLHLKLYFYKKKTWLWSIWYLVYFLYSLILNR